MSFSPQEYVTILRTAGTGLADAARGNLDANVPSCPDWSVRDLVNHVANVHRMGVSVLEAGGGPPAGRRPAPDGEPVDVYLAGLGDLCAALESRTPDAAAWSWSPGEQTAAFWYQRMAQETAVHRWDAQLAAGDPQPIEAAVAVDGIDEVCDRFLGKLRPVAGSGETIHLHTTDADGEWVLTLAPAATTVTREHAKADAAARGTASDLLLTLWGRTAGPLETFGDTELLDRFLAAMRR